MTNRRKIEHRLLRKGSNANKITKDRIGSGSIEVKHLNFGDIGSGDYLVDLADTDVLALSDASNSNAMRGLKLGDFKNYISASTATGRTGSVQFNAGGAGGQFGGNLTVTSDGTHLTASAALTTGTYVFRLTSGSTGLNGSKTYGPVNNTAQLLHVAGTGSSDFVFFLSNGGSTAKPSAQSVNFQGTAQEFRVEAVSGITDWRIVAGNFFQKMKEQLQTSTGIATVTSQSAANINGTASITIAYNSIAGGIRVGGGRNSGRSLDIYYSKPLETTPFNASFDSSYGQDPIQRGGDSGQAGESGLAGVFPETTTSGSGPNATNLYFVKSALGTSPDDVRIASNGSQQLDLIASHTSSGIVSIKGGTGVHVKTTLNDGFIFTTASTGVASLVHGSDQLGRGVNLQRGNIQFRDALGSGPSIVIRSGSADVLATKDEIQTGSTGVYVFRLTSGSTGLNGSKTYGPVNNTAQLLHVAGTGSSDFVFFLSNGGSTAKPSAQSVNFQGTAQEFRVEAVSGITDWRNIAQNFFQKMKEQLQTSTGIATVTSQSAADINGTSSITITYDSIPGGIRVGSGRDAGRSLNHYYSKPVNNESNDGNPFNANFNSSYGTDPIQRGGDSGQDGESGLAGVFPETTTSGSADSVKTSIQLRQSAAKLYFDNGTTYHVGANSNVQYLSASAAKFDSLEVTEIISRTTTKDSLEIADNLVVAGVSGSKHGDHIGGGFQLGGVVGVSGTGSAGLLSMTLGDPSVGKGSLLLGVSDTRIVSVTSGSFYNAAGAVGDGMLAVTGALSSSLLRSQNVAAGTITGSTLTVHRLVSNKLAGTGIITQDNIQTASIVAAHIGTGQVTHAKLAASVATADNFQSGSVNTGHVVDSNVTTVKINDAAVTKAKIGTGAVTLAKMATGSVSTIQILDANVTKAKIAVGAVTVDKMATGSVSTPQILDANVTKAKIAVGAVTVDKMATGSVSTAQILDANVTKAKIAVGAVMQKHLATGSVGDKALNVSVVQNSTDAHGGISWSSGKLSLGFVRRDFGRSGNNFVTDAVSSPFTTASLSAQPASGTVQVYFNGTLLAPEHFAGAGKVAGSTQADYRIVTSSANAFAIHVHPDLALDSDDVLTVTYFSGSGLAS
ncbi:hypothetical protein N9989_00340 [bacterium]|nr:hypothetical protein [bacterium]